MLILTRSLGEKIRIGDNITVRITAVHGNQVRIGIDAPQDVLILREEVADRENQSARMTSATINALAAE